MNKDFTGEVSTYNKDKFKILAPGEQFWDGLDVTEKENRVLIVPKNKKDENGNIKYNEYEELVMHKYGKDNQPLEGVKFCIAKPLTKEETKDKTEEEILKMMKCDETYNSLTQNWVTNKDGILNIPTNELPLYNQTIIETKDMQDTYKPIKLDIYVDPGNRFLGEVKGTDFITYDELLTEIGKQGSVGITLDLGNDSTTGGNWLKIYDARLEKILYIAKKPITNYVSWETLNGLGLVNGKIVTIHASEQKSKTYKVRLINGVLNGNSESKGSEWNRFILPLVKYNRYGYGSTTQLEDALKEKFNDDYKIQITKYNWFGDLTVEDSNKGEYGQFTWTQMKYASFFNLRGSDRSYFGAASRSRSVTTVIGGFHGFRPVLEEIN